MKKSVRILFALFVTLLLGLGLAQSSADADGDGIGDAAEVILGTDPNNSDTDGDGVNDLDDVNPTLVNVAPQAATGDTAFIINEVLVENNYDPVAKKDAADHLEILVQNMTQEVLSGFSVYYTITDLVTQDVQSYLVPLPDFTLAPGEAKAIHIDNSGAPGHYRANPNSMFFTSENERQVDVMVTADGYASVMGGVLKDAGGAEVAD